MIFSEHAPVLEYSNKFYDGESFNENNVKKHPYVEQFNVSSFFDHDILIICGLAVILSELKDHLKQHLHS